MVLIDSLPQVMLTLNREVSVPLRGLWFLSKHGPIFKKAMAIMFPSPCGDYGSYHDSWAFYSMDEFNEVSVPLRGLWFLSAYNKG